MNWQNYNKNSLKMYIWLNYWILIFWFSFFIFFFNNSNFFTLLLISEFIWIILYVLAITNGLLFDELNFFSFTFFFLGLAGIEFSFCLLLLLLFKSVNFSLNLKKNEKFFLNNIYSSANYLNLNKYF